MVENHLTEKFYAVSIGSEIFCTRSSSISILIVLLSKIGVAPGLNLIAANLVDPPTEGGV